MISKLKYKIVTILLWRVILLAYRLTIVGAYRYLSRLNPDQDRSEIWRTAIEFSGIVVDENRLLTLLGGKEEDDHLLHSAFEDVLVLDALSRMYSARRILEQLNQRLLVQLSTSTEKWVSEDSVVVQKQLQQIESKTTERLNAIDGVLDVIEPINIVVSPWPLLQLKRDTSRKLKEVKKELDPADQAEARQIIYESLIPDHISFSELGQLGGIILFAYLFGTYIFVRIVYSSLESDVVGLQLSDYLQFAAYHTTWELIVAPFVFVFGMIHNIERSKPVVLPYVVGDRAIPSFNRNQNRSRNLGLFLSLVALNIPLWSESFGTSISVVTESVLGQAITVDQALILNVTIVLILVLGYVPYKYIVKQAFLLYVTSVFSLLIVGSICWQAISTAEELRSPSSSDWKYDFNDGVVTSSDYSYVYESDVYLIFYKREDEEFVLKKVDAMQSFSGTL